jgi:hypothetical protein
MGTISGTVTSSGSAVQGATVAVVDSSTWSVVGTDTSDANGAWAVSGLAGGVARYHALVQYDDGGQFYNAESLPFLTVEWTLTPARTTAQVAGPTASISTGSAIPDSALLRFPFGQRSDSTLEETIANADGTANGLTNVSGDWIDGYAESGDGTDDYGDLGDWSGVNFGQRLVSDWGLILSIKTTASSGNPLGLFTTDTWEFRFTYEAATNLALRISDKGRNGFIQDIELSTSVNDGNKYRIAVGGDGVAASDKVAFVNGTDATSVAQDEGDHDPNNDLNFSRPIYSHAINNGGSVDRNIDCVIDDIIPLGSKPTASVAQDDYDRQPWS